jgi:hypothetical protein
MSLYNISPIDIWNQFAEIAIEAVAENRRSQEKKFDFPLTPDQNEAAYLPRTSTLPPETTTLSALWYSDKNRENKIRTICTRFKR